MKTLILFAVAVLILKFTDWNALAILVVGISLAAWFLVLFQKPLDGVSALYKKLDNRDFS